MYEAKQLSVAEYLPVSALDMAALLEVVYQSDQKRADGDLLANE